MACVQTLQRKQADETPRLVTTESSNTENATTPSPKALSQQVDAEVGSTRKAPIEVDLGQVALEESPNKPEESVLIMEEIGWGRSRRGLQTDHTGMPLRENVGAAQRQVIRLFALKRRARDMGLPTSRVRRIEMSYGGYGPAIEADALEQLLNDFCLGSKQQHTNKRGSAKCRVKDENDRSAAAVRAEKLPRSKWSKVSRSLGSSVPHGKIDTGFGSVVHQAMRAKARQQQQQQQQQQQHTRTQKQASLHLGIDSPPISAEQLTTLQARFQSLQKVIAAEKPP